MIDWNSPIKTGIRCKAVAKKGRNAGNQCTNSAVRGRGDLCISHYLSKLKSGGVRSLEAVRLENVEGLAHVAVANALSKCGVSVINQNGGWPDLLVKRNNRLFAVEVKKGGDRLRSNQREVLNELSNALSCFVLRLDGPCADGEITWAQLLEQLHVEAQLPEYFGA